MVGASLRWFEEVFYQVRCHDALSFRCPVVYSAERIYTGFKPTRYVEAVTVYGGYVVYAGFLGDAMRAAQEISAAVGCGKPRLVEFDGVIVPGFVDAHLHIRGIGATKYSIDLSDTESLEELLELVRHEADRFNDWVLGRGWDQERLGGWPTRYELDEVVPDKPVVLLRVCGHAAALNTKAMEALGLLESSSPLVDRGCDGKPTGLVFEELAAQAYREAIQSLDPVRLVVEGAEEALRYGITLAGAMDVDAHVFRGLVAARRMGLLRLRLRVYLSQELFEKLDQLGAVPVLGDNLLRVVGVKLYMDGSLGARTAWLREPYSDEPRSRGRRLLSAEDLANIASRARKWRLDVAVHAIGDAAVEEALRGFAASGCKCRLEHASLAPPDLVEKMASLGVRVAVQPRFLVSDSWAVDRLGPGRARWLYPFRSMLTSGVLLGFSSDAPVEPLNPLEGIYSAVTRGTLAQYTMREALDVETALHLYTAGSALLLGETRAGCLELGCFADMAVLDRDPLEVDVEEITGIGFNATIVAGETVWQRS
ncbi:metal-dependent hydrolase [Pyrodictium delaneyi]|uniref:Metal-dependent hydrolase n=1 Tax=Pyrodictium delaneyi TaxID=1273541 RepID=A0A0P0N3V2_9CREN|nr:metal-dependent hydrolase [Pyrodictium delaneyi]